MSDNLLVRADEYVRTMLSRADADNGYPLWHGWALNDAWRAGYRAAQAAMPPREPTQGMIDEGVDACESAIIARTVWRVMHDAFTQEQTSGRTTTNFLTNASGERLTGPLDHQSREEWARQAAAKLDALRDAPPAAQPAEPPATDGPAADPIADLCARLRDEYEGCPSPVTTARVATLREAADAVERLARERDEARDGWRMANGVADLAMKHRDSAEAERERLARERDDIREMLQNTNRDAARLANIAYKYKWQVRDTCTRAERAEAERDRANADAARYRWLRDGDGPQSSRWSRWRIEHWASPGPTWADIRGADLDAAIDAHLKEKP